MGPLAFVLARDPEGKAWYIDHAVSPAICHLMPGCRLGWEEVAAANGLRISVAHFKAILHVLDNTLWMVQTFISECQQATNPSILNI